MWPPRKIMLALPAAVPGESFDAFFKALGIELEILVIDAPARSEETKAGAEACFDDLTLGCTELVLWPGCAEKVMGRKEVSPGIPQQEWSTFLHNLWQGEVILPIPGPNQVGEDEGKPWLFCLLQEAGYEPSLLWQTLTGKWLGERGMGIHWVVPEDWAGFACADPDSLGRRAQMFPGEYTWKERFDRVDFYADYPRRFVGSILLENLPARKPSAYETIALALALGVSWGTIDRAVIKMLAQKEWIKAKDTLHMETAPEKKGSAENKAGNDVEEDKAGENSGNKGKDPAQAEPEIEYLVG